jgi:hypothetical protein
MKQELAARLRFTPPRSIHSGLAPGWFIGGAGERARSGAHLQPRLDVDKIPQAAWGMLTDVEAPMKAPKSIWRAFFQQLVEAAPITLEAMVDILDKRMDAELEGLRGYVAREAIDDYDDEIPGLEGEDEDEIKPGLGDIGTLKDDADVICEQASVEVSYETFKKLIKDVLKLKIKTSGLESALATKTTRLEGRVKLLEFEITLLKASLANIKTRDFQSTTRFLAFQRHINQALAEIGGRANRGQAGMDPVLQQDLLMRLGSMETRVMGPDSPLEKLQVELTMIRSRAAGQGVQIGRFTFSTYPKVTLFVKTYPNGNFGLCLNAVSLLSICSIRLMLTRIRRWLRRPLAYVPSMVAS